MRNSAGGLQRVYRILSHARCVLTASELTSLLQHRAQLARDLDSGSQTLPAAAAAAAALHTSHHRVHGTGELPLQQMRSTGA